MLRLRCSSDGADITVDCMSPFGGSQSATDERLDWFDAPSTIQKKATPVPAVSREKVKCMCCGKSFLTAYYCEEHAENCFVDVLSSPAVPVKTQAATSSCSHARTEQEYRSIMYRQLIEAENLAEKASAKSLVFQSKIPIAHLASSGSRHDGSGSHKQKHHAVKSETSAVKSLAKRFEQLAASNSASYDPAISAVRSFKVGLSL